MNSSIRPPYTPHTLRARTPDGRAFEVELDPIMQPKLAVKLAYQLARYLAASASADLMGADWEIGARDDLEGCDADLLECTVEVFRRVPPGYPGAVHGYALLLEVPVAPGVPLLNPDALRSWPAI